MSSTDLIARGLALSADSALARSRRADKLRRAASKALISNPEDNAAATGVTLTVNASADASLSLYFNALLAPGLFNFYGGKPTPSGSGTQYYFPTASVLPATNGNVGNATNPASPGNSAWGWRAEFMTASPKVEIRIGTSASSLFRVIVDGQYVNPQGTAGIDFIGYVVLDFSGAVKPRTISIEASDTSGFRGVAVDPSHNLWQPTSSVDEVTVLASGDSYTEGQGATSPGLFAWVQQAGKLLGWTDVRQVAVGGTGYVNNGGGLNRSVVLDQIDRWLPVNSDLTADEIDIIIFAAGFNDHGLALTPAEIAAAALLCWRRARLLYPEAWIIVLGPWGGSRGPDPRTRDIEAALLAAFVSWRDSYAHYEPVSPVQAPTNTGSQTSWLTGNGFAMTLTADLSGATSGTMNRPFRGTTALYNLVFSDGSTRTATLTLNSTSVSWTGAVTATRNVRAYFDRRGTSEFCMSHDLVHPVNAGHSLIARRFTQSIRDALAQNPN